MPQIFACFSVHTIIALMMIALLVPDVLLHKVEIKLQVRQKRKEGILPCFSSLGKHGHMNFCVCRTVNKTLFCFFLSRALTDFEEKIEGL